jgi:hypothetical protein
MSLLWFLFTQKDYLEATLHFHAPCMSVCNDSLLRQPRLYSWICTKIVSVFRILGWKIQNPDIRYGQVFTSNGQRSLLEGTSAAAGATARRTDQLSVACTAVSHSTKASSLLRCFQCRKWRTILNQAPVECRHEPQTHYRLNMGHQLEKSDKQISNGRYVDNHINLPDPIL